MEKFYREYLAKRRDDVSAFMTPPSYSNGEAGATLRTTLFQYCVIREILLALEYIDLANIDCKCVKMTASDEWHFLCAPHAEKPRECSALDYMKHTIDSTTSLLFQLQHQSQNMSKHVYSILRRLYRIYGHLYFHHYEVFVRERFHCQRFYFFLKEWGLFKQDMMIIPENVFQSSPPPSLGLGPSDSPTVVDLQSVTMQLSADD